VSGTINTVAAEIEKARARYVSDLDRLRSVHGQALVQAALALVKQRELRAHMRAGGARHKQRSLQQQQAET
jgi:hypothetical protein